MFTQNVIESASQRVQLHEVPADALEAIIKYIYTAEIDITNETVQNLFTAASLFEMLPVCELCTKHMISELHVTNCLEVFLFGSFHSWTILKEAACQYIVDYFDYVCDDEGWARLSWQELSGILARDDLNASREETVYNVLLGWIRNDKESSILFRGI